MKKCLILISLGLALRASAQLVVEDPLVLAQLILQLERQGDPAAIQRLPGVEQLLRSLAQAGVGLTLEQLQQAASGSRAFIYDADGLYRRVNDRVINAAGKEILRAEDLYRRFDAIIRMIANYKAVHDETELRRQQLRNEIRATSAEAQSAGTQTMVDKLKVVSTAQGAELAAIDRERDAAFSRVLVQDIQNRNAAAQEQLAQKEERAAAFQMAHEKFAGFMRPSTAPVVIPGSGRARR